MIKQVAAGLLLSAVLMGCSNVMTYINSDNRHHNTGCAARTTGDGIQLGNKCDVAKDEQ